MWTFPFSSSQSGQGVCWSDVYTAPYNSETLPCQSFQNQRHLLQSTPYTLKTCHPLARRPRTTGRSTAARLHTTLLGEAYSHLCPCNYHRSSPYTGFHLSDHSPQTPLRRVHFYLYRRTQRPPLYQRIQLLWLWLFSGSWGLSQGLDFKLSTPGRVINCGRDSCK